MSQENYDDLDAALFELNADLKSRYQRQIQGPIDNKTFLRNVAIGAGVILAAPLIALTIAYLLGH